MAIGKKHPDDLIDQLVRVDEQLADAHDTRAQRSTRIHGKAKESELAECLELIDRVRRDVPVWPGDVVEAGDQPDLSWLYKQGGQPSKIGRFNIQCRLGVGGFGLVFLAQDPELDRDVALKVPRLETLVGEESKQRFLRESKLAASLAHENIAAVYEAGTLGPLNYIASAYYAGGSITELLERRGGRLPPKAAATVVARLAEAVQHAHSRGILHRDIKPSNIMLDLPDGQTFVREGEAPAEPRGDNNAKAPSDGSAGASPSPFDDPVQLARSVRLVDFGLARNIETDVGNTRSGAVVGTPAYMAPEQAAGKSHELGRAADIYGLGATLYFLLTGNAPFAKDSVFETITAVRNEEPAPPSRIAPGIARDLDAICLKCLEKDPATRYESATALADDLNRFLDGQPTIARSIGAVGRLKKWCVRNPALATALGTLLAVLIVGIAASSSLWLRSERHRKAATAKADEALVQARHARKAVNNLLASIAREPSIRSESMTKFRQQLFGAAAEYYDELRDERPHDPEVAKEYVGTLYGLSRMHTWLGDPKKALEISEQAVALCRTVTDTKRTTVLVELLTSRADDLMMLHRFDEAIESTLEAVSVAEQAGDAADDQKLQQTVIKALVSAAQPLAYSGQLDRAEEYINRAIDWGTRYADAPVEEWPADIQLARVLRCKTEIAEQLRQLDDVEVYGNLGLKLFRQIAETDPTRVTLWLESSATLRKALGKRYAHLQDYAGQEKELAEERSMIEQLIQRHPDIPALKSRLADLELRISYMLYYDGRPDEALSQIMRSLEWITGFKQESSDPQLQVETTETQLRQLLGVMHLEAGRFDEARATLEEALAVCEVRCDNEQAPLSLRGGLGSLHTDLGTVDQQEGDFESAAVHFQAAIEILEPLVEQAASSKATDFLATAYLRYGGLLMEQQHYAESLEWIERFLAFAPDHDSTDDAKQRREELLRRLQATQ